MLAVLATGCATSQTVHWNDNLPTVAQGIAELSVEHNATIRTMDGVNYQGTNLAVVRDSLMWITARGGESRKRALNDVESIEFKIGRHALVGALVGFGAGVAYVAIDCSRGPPCSHSVPSALLNRSVLFSTVVGAILGLLDADKVIFVYEIP